MKKILSLILAVLLVFSISLNLFACKNSSNENSEEIEKNEDTKLPDKPVVPDTPGGDEDVQPPSPPDDEKEPELPKDEVLFVPPFKEFNRGTVNFNDFKYVSFNTAELKKTMKSTLEIIETNSKSFDEQLALLKKIDEGYTKLLTAYCYSNLKVNENSSDKYFSEELQKYQLDFTVVDDLLNSISIACAKSPHKKEFETNVYSGEGSLDKYLNEEKAPQELLDLLSEEQVILNKYKTLSTKNIVINYNGIIKSADAHIADLQASYSDNEKEYSKHLEEVLNLYYIALNNMQVEIYLDLLKIRSKIASQRGEKSYIPIAYKSMNHSYSEKDMIDLINNILSFVIPVYYELCDNYFDPFLSSHEEPILQKNQILNLLYKTYKGIDSTLADNFHYMLQYELYNIKEANLNRYDSCFNIKIFGNNSPFIFITLNNNCEDLFNIAHEFGHFSEAIVNNFITSSVDVTEISSQALELITMLQLENQFDVDTFTYLKFIKLKSALEILYFQSFYTYFEMLAYRIPESEISLQSLEKVITQVCKTFMVEDLPVSEFMISHYFETPFYVQSYVTSMAVALKNYTLVLADFNNGMKVYNKLVDNSDLPIDLNSYLKSCGMDSLFSQEFIKDISNSIYRNITGKNFDFSKYSQNVA